MCVCVDVCDGFSAKRYVCWKISRQLFLFFHDLILSQRQPRLCSWQDFDIKRLITIFSVSFLCSFEWHKGNRTISIRFSFVTISIVVLFTQGHRQEIQSHFSEKWTNGHRIRGGGKLAWKMKIIHRWLHSAAHMLKCVYTEGQHLYICTIK
jgi:hypothetical protein